MSLRLAVTGREGQVVRALREAAVSHGVTVIALGRPGLDLERPDDIAAVIAGARPDAVVNAAAFTAVDLAETEPERAMTINGTGAGAVAAAAKALNVPVIQLSTDYVFDGTKATPYIESDLALPTGVYGASKLAGEQAVAAAGANHAILRTSWVYAPHGKNFVLTMLRLGATRDMLTVVADQMGCPTYAPDIAAGIITVARNLLARPDDADLRGIFHMAGGGETSWAGFAEAIFAAQAAAGGRPVHVQPVTTADYPTPARRPANSRLDCGKLGRLHAITLPHWHDSLAICMATLLTEGPRQ
jgi:dTDP-4-dehydrorhamnose reductase